MIRCTPPRSARITTLRSELISSVSIWRTPDPSRAVRIAALALCALTMAPALPAVGRVRGVDVTQSKITIHVSKKGMLGFLGDDHDIEAPVSSGSYDSASHTVDIAVDAARLRVLDPKLSPQKRHRRSEQYGRS